MALSPSARYRNANMAEAADELFVEIQAWKRELADCTNLLEARAAIIRERVRQLQPRQRERAA